MPDHRLIYRFIPFVILLALSSCKNDSSTIAPRQASPRINLDTLLVESTEIDLHISTTNTKSLGNIFIKRDSITIFSAHIKGKDTVVVDTSLVPFHAYQYSAYRLSNDMHTRIDSTRKIPFRTMDTTSHDFAWEIDTIGDGLSSILRDVSIINDTCVWVVGLIRRLDSTGQFDPLRYNAALWNGKLWTVYCIPTFQYPNIIDTAELFSVIGFSTNDVWTFSRAGSYSHWDGYNWSTDYIAAGPGIPSKFWGTSSHDLYLAGVSGEISHFDGSHWNNILTPATVNFTDIGGSPDGKYVWVCGFDECCAGTYLYEGEGRNDWHLVRDGTASEGLIKADSLSGTYASVFVPNQHRLFVGSSAGIYECPALTQGEGKRYSFTSRLFPGFPRRIRGTGVNDITIVGDLNFVAHYNGSSVRYYPQFREIGGNLNSVDQKSHLVVAVGLITDPINSKGLVIRGRR